MLLFSLWVPTLPMFCPTSWHVAQCMLFFFFSCTSTFTCTNYKPRALGASRFFLVKHSTPSGLPDAPVWYGDFLKLSELPDMLPDTSWCYLMLPELSVCCLALISTPSTPNMLPGASSCSQYSPLMVEVTLV